MDHRHGESAEHRLMREFVELMERLVRAVEGIERHMRPVKGRVPVRGKARVT